MQLIRVTVSVDPILNSQLHEGFVEEDISPFRVVQRGVKILISLLKYFRNRIVWAIIFEPTPFQIFTYDTVKTALSESGTFR